VAISPEVSKVHVAAELERARPLLDAQGWQIEVFDGLRMQASILAPSINGAEPELFTYEFNFENYRELPPIVDALNLETGERNTPKCFPTGGRGYYHGNQRICARWSRNAYGVMSGPHGDWPIGDWAAADSKHSDIGSMLTLLRNLLFQPESGYAGRAA